MRTIQLFYELINELSGARPGQYDAPDMPPVHAKGTVAEQRSMSAEGPNRFIKRWLQDETVSFLRFRYQPQMLSLSPIKLLSP